MNKDTFMQMFRNKKEVLNCILKDMNTSDKINDNISKMVKLSKDSKLDSNKAIQNILISTVKLSEINKRLCMLMLVYVQGHNYTSDAASAAMKFGGNGEDILMEMMNQKMKR